MWGGIREKELGKEFGVGVVRGVYVVVVEVWKVFGIGLRFGVIG